MGMLFPALVNKGLSKSGFSTKSGFRWGIRSQGLESVLHRQRLLSRLRGVPSVYSFECGTGALSPLAARPL